MGISWRQYNHHRCIFFNKKRMTLGFEEEQKNPVGDVALRLTVGWGCCEVRATTQPFERKEHLIPGPKFLDGEKIILQGNCSP